MEGLCGCCQEKIHKIIAISYCCANEVCSQCFDDKRQRKCSCGKEFSAFLLTPSAGRTTEALKVIKPYIDGNIVSLKKSLERWKELLKESYEIKIKPLPDLDDIEKNIPETEVFAKADFKNLEFFQDETLADITLGEKYVALSDLVLDVETSVILMAKIEDLFNKTVRLPRLKTPGLALINHSVPWNFFQKVFVGISISQNYFEKDIDSDNLSIQSVAVSQDSIILGTSQSIIYLSHLLEIQKEIPIDVEKVMKMAIDYEGKVFALVQYLEGVDWKFTLFIFEIGKSAVKLKKFGTKIQDFAIVGDGKHLVLVHKAPKGFTLRHFCLETMNFINDIHLDFTNGITPNIYLFPSTDKTFILCSEYFGNQKVIEYTIDSLEVVSNRDYIIFAHTPLFYLADRFYCDYDSNIPNACILGVENQICQMPDGSFINIIEIKEGKIRGRTITTY